MTAFREQCIRWRTYIPIRQCRSRTFLKSGLSNDQPLLRDSSTTWPWFSWLRSIPLRQSRLQRRCASSSEGTRSSFAASWLMSRTGAMNFLYCRCLSTYKTQQRRRERRTPLSSRRCRMPYHSSRTGRSGSNLRQNPTGNRLAHWFRDPRTPQKMGLGRLASPATTATTTTAAANPTPTTASSASLLRPFFPSANASHIPAANPVATPTSFTSCRSARTDDAA